MIGMLREIKQKIENLADKKDQIEIPEWKHDN